MANTDLKKQYVETTSHQVVSDVARATGVEPHAVEKVLAHLGLQSALAHRISLTSGIRIAAGQVSE